MPSMMVLGDGTLEWWVGHRCGSKGEGLHIFCERPCQELQGTGNLFSHLHTKGRPGDCMLAVHEEVLNRTNHPKHASSTFLAFKIFYLRCYPRQSKRDAKSLCKIEEPTKNYTLMYWWKCFPRCSCKTLDVRTINACFSTIKKKIQ